MNEHQASRTLLKSLPELWAECSDAQSLAKHLGDSVGEIRITKLEPEHTVAWEGERASGTVKLEPSGWGTRVRLACSMPEPKPDVQRAPEPDPPPAQPTPEATSPPPSEQPVAPARGRLLQRVMRFLGPGREVAKPDAAPPHQSAASEPPPPEPPSPPEPPPPREPPPPEPAEATEEVDGADPLAAALDSLGQAHHRPFSRA